MPIYRAIDRSKTDAETIYYPRPTRRVPSNIPYLVDNLWEWSRPEHLPSRRQAAYASPCPEQAKASSIAAESIACNVSFSGNRLIAQHLEVFDAKEHKDVRTLPKFILQLLGTDWPSKPIEDRSKEALLWTPGLCQGEIHNILTNSCLGNHIDQIHEKITFWLGVELVNDTDQLPSASGEIFFEYTDGYRLIPVGE